MILIVPSQIGFPRNSISNLIEWIRSNLHGSRYFWGLLCIVVDIHLTSYLFQDYAKDLNTNFELSSTISRQESRCTHTY